MFISFISISSICFSFTCLHHSSFEMISLSSYVAWQFTCVTFCSNHWYFIIQWILFTITSWNLCLPFLNFSTIFCLKTVLYLVFLKVFLYLHCYELTTIELFLALCLSEWLQLRGKTAVSSLWYQKKCLLRHKKSKK